MVAFKIRAFELAGLDVLCKPAWLPILHLNEDTLDGIFPSCDAVFNLSSDSAGPEAMPFPPDSIFSRSVCASAKFISKVCQNYSLPNRH